MLPGTGNLTQIHGIQQIRRMLRELQVQKSLLLRAERLSSPASPPRVAIANLQHTFGL